MEKGIVGLLWTMLSSNSSIKYPIVSIYQVFPTLNDAVPGKCVGLRGSTDVGEWRALAVQDAYHYGGNDILSGRC